MDSIVHLVPPEASGPLLSVLRGTRDNAGLLGLLSIAGLIYSGSAVFGSLEEAFNRIYRVPSRGFLRQKLMATGMLLSCTVLLLLSLLAASLAQVLNDLSSQAVEGWFAGAPWLAGWAPWLADLLDLRALGVSLAWSLSLGWSFLFFLFVYWVVPNRRFAPGAVWPGAALAALLFLGITELFPLYLDYVGQFDRYGAAFALVLLLMTWFYFLAHILLFGATVNALIEGGRRGRLVT